MTVAATEIETVAANSATATGAEIVIEAGTGTGTAGRSVAPALRSASGVGRRTTMANGASQPTLRYGSLCWLQRWLKRRVRRDDRREGEAPIEKEGNLESVGSIVGQLG